MSQKLWIFRQVVGDLFSAPKEYTLAHCVAADLKMGAGIAIKFRDTYGRIPELRSQNVKAGGVAVLTDADRRFIYYLVSKNDTYKQPTYPDLTESLRAMKTHMKANDVNKLAIPKIGCGIDGLEWPKVSDILDEVFSAEPIEIVVYEYSAK